MSCYTLSLGNICFQFEIREDFKTHQPTRLEWVYVPTAS